MAAGGGAVYTGMGGGGLDFRYDMRHPMRKCLSINDLCPPGILATLTTKDVSSSVNCLLTSHVRPDKARHLHQGNSRNSLREPEAVQVAGHSHIGSREFTSSIVDAT